MEECKLISCSELSIFAFKQTISTFWISWISKSGFLMAHSLLAGRYHSTVSSELIVFKDEVRWKLGANC